MPFSSHKSMTYFHLPLSEFQLKEVFDEHDSNKDGRLSKEELEEALEHLGAHIPGWRARRCLHHADADKDGYIGKEELDELVKYAVKLGYKLRTHK